MKPYSIALAANEILDLKIGGEYFLLDAAPQLVAVEFYGAGNLKRDEALEDAQPGDWATPQNGFASIKLTNGAVVQTVRFYVARGRVGRFRVTGDVNAAPLLTTGAVPQGADAYTFNGNAFIGGWDQTPGAGVFSYVQVLNPAASGKLVYVDRLYYTCEVLQVVHLRDYATALLNNTGQLKNKSWGGAAPSTQLRANNEAAQRGTLVSEVMVTNVNSNLGAEILRDGPILLQAGEGLIVGSATANQRPNLHVELREFVA